ncbi:MAG: hypothetical protein AAGK01_04970 [Pseudomonadota bacterium]
MKNFIASITALLATIGVATLGFPTTSLTNSIPNHQTLGVDSELTSVVSFELA